MNSYFEYIYILINLNFILIYILWLLIYLILNCGKGSYSFENIWRLDFPHKTIATIDGKPMESTANTPPKNTRKTMTFFIGGPLTDHLLHSHAYQMHAFLTATPLQIACLTRSPLTDHLFHSHACRIHTFLTATPLQTACLTRSPIKSMLFLFTAP